MATDIDDIKLSELVTFVHAARSRSLSAAARVLEVTPSQVSKSLARLESRLRTTLVTRTARGIELTEHGRELLPRVLELSGLLRSLGSSAKPKHVLTTAAPSYLALTVMTQLATSLPEYLWRVTEQSPAFIRASLPDRAIDFALLPGSERAPSGWTSDQIGTFVSGVLARPSFAKQIGKLPTTPARIAELPFVMPLRQSTLSVIPSDDGCPIPVSERKVGSEAQTIVVGMEIACTSDQIIFGPLLAAARYIKEGALCHIPVSGWDPRTPIQLLSSESVLARTRRDVLAHARRIFATEV